MSQDPGAAGSSAQQPDPYAAPIPAPDAGSAPASMYGQAPWYAYGQPPSYVQAPSYGYGVHPGDAQAPYGLPTVQPPTYGQAGAGQVPTYGPSPYGYPPPPYPSAAGWDRSQIDSLSLAGFIVALTGFLLIVTFPVGLGLSIAGLVRTKRRGTGGRGFAITGIVVGAFGTVFVIGGIAWAMVVGFQQGVRDGISSAHARAESGTTLPDYRLVQGLTPGECLQGDASSWSLGDAVPVACTAPHNLEVVSVYKLAERPVNSTDEPGAELDKALSTCEDDVLAANSALLGADDWSDVWAPHPDQWDAGERSAYCLWGTDSTVTGSATQGFGAQSSNL